MKNKKAQILSIFLSACMLGTSAPVSAADLSSELFSADDITDTEAPADASQDQPAADDEVSAPDSTDTPEEPVDDLTQSPDDPAPAETGAVDSSTDNTDPFSAGEEDDFSDSEENDDFSSGETEQALAGILDDSLETQMTRKKALLLKQTSRYLLLSLPHVRYIKATTWRARIILTGLHLWNLILLQVRMVILCAFRAEPLMARS